MSNVKTVSAREVREYLRGREDLVPEQHRHNLVSRGRLHTDLIKIYTKAKRSKAKYVVGTV